VEVAMVEGFMEVSIELMKEKFPMEMMPGSHGCRWRNCRHSIR
jgi:hypothetical protein